MVIMQQQTEITVASVITEHPTDGSSYPEVNLPDQPNRRIRIRTYGGGVPWKLHTRWGYSPPRSACRSRSQIAVSCVS